MKKEICDEKIKKNTRYYSLRVNVSLMVCGLLVCILALAHIETFLAPYILGTGAWKVMTTMSWPSGWRVCFYQWRNPSKPVNSILSTSVSRSIVFYSNSSRSQSVDTAKIIIYHYENYKFNSLDFLWKCKENGLNTKISFHKRITMGFLWFYRVINQNYWLYGTTNKKMNNSYQI